MIEKSIDTEFGCEEYCQPVYKTCVQNEKDEDGCEEKHESCLSFCQYA